MEGQLSVPSGTRLYHDLISFRDFSVQQLSGQRVQYSPLNYPLQGPRPESRVKSVQRKDFLCALGDFQTDILV